jgi:predicted amidohydrolase
MTIPMKMFQFDPLQSNNVIDTSLGKIGVGTCAENHFVSFLRRMHDAPWLVYTEPDRLKRQQR